MTPLAWLKGRGNCLQLLQLLALEDKRECGCQEKCHDEEGGRCCGRWVPSSGRCPCIEKKEGGGDGRGGSWQ
jgi:hypothetical protein